jgi:hypothetical protein
MTCYRDQKASSRLPYGYDNAIGLVISMDFLFSANAPVRLQYSC